FFLFGGFPHIGIDGAGITLLAHRIATLYAAIVSDAPIPPAFFGSLQELVRCESEYEASSEYLADEAYWTENLPPANGQRYRLLKAAGEGDPLPPSAPVRVDPAVLRQVQEVSDTWGMPRSSILTAASALLVRGWCAEGAEA